MAFSRQEYWSGQPFLSPGDLPDPGNEPGFPALQADLLLFESPGKLISRNPLIAVYHISFQLGQYLEHILNTEYC